MAMDQTLKVVLTAEPGGLVAGLTKANSLISNFATKANKAFTSLTTAFSSFGGLVAGGAIVAGFRRITNSLEELAVASKKTGVGVEELAKLRFAAEQADVPAESLAKALKFLNQTLGEARAGNEKAAKSLEALGVATTDSALPALVKVADTISSIPDAATRASLLTDVFKKSWEDIVPLLDGGGDAIRQAGDELERLGGVPSQKAAEAADRLNDNLNKLSTSITGPLTVAIGGLLPLIDSIAQRFTAVAESSRGFVGTLEDLGKRVGLSRLIQEASNSLDIWQRKLDALRAQEAAGDFPFFGGTAQLYTDIKRAEEAVLRFQGILENLRKRAGQLQENTPAVDVLIEGDPDAAAKLTAQATAASRAASAAVPPVVVPIALGPSGAITNYADLQAEFARQQQGFAAGGLIQGPGTAVSDSILARLSAGEFVVKAAAVKNYGLGFLERLNSMELPRFAAGGPVGTPVHLHLDGHSVGPMMAGPSVAKQLGRLLSTEVLKRGRR